MTSKGIQYVWVCKILGGLAAPKGTKIQPKIHATSLQNTRIWAYSPPLCELIPLPQILNVYSVHVYIKWIIVEILPESSWFTSLIIKHIFIEALSINTFGTP